MRMPSLPASLYPSLSRSLSHSLSLFLFSLSLSFSLHIFLSKHTKEDHFNTIRSGRGRVIKMSDVGAYWSTHLTSYICEINALPPGVFLFFVSAPRARRLPQGRRFSRQKTIPSRCVYRDILPRPPLPCPILSRCVHSDMISSVLNATTTTKPDCLGRYVPYKARVYAT